MATTTELTKETDRRLARLWDELLDLRDMVEHWDDYSTWDRLGWDLEWRGTLLSLDTMRERAHAGTLTPKQDRAYAALVDDLRQLFPKMTTLGIPLPTFD